MLGDRTVLYALDSVLRRRMDAVRIAMRMGIRFHGCEFVFDGIARIGIVGRVGVSFDLVYIADCRFTVVIHYHYLLTSYSD